MISISSLSFFRRNRVNRWYGRRIYRSFPFPASSDPPRLASPHFNQIIRFTLQSPRCGISRYILSYHQACQCAAYSSLSIMVDMALAPIDTFQTDPNTDQSALVGNHVSIQCATIVWHLCSCYLTIDEKFDPTRFAWATDTSMKPFSRIFYMLHHINSIADTYKLLFS